MKSRKKLSQHSLREKCQKYIYKKKHRVWLVNFQRLYLGHIWFTLLHLKFKENIYKCKDNKIIITRIWRLSSYESFNQSTTHFNQFKIPINKYLIKIFKYS